uniref:stizolobate synthase n=1 Tax=Glottiphyllum longum TaxID=2602777 RepID=A0A5B8X854_9CARY|nr:4,5-dioxygenase-like protein [Glottiphyllum longum]
MVAANEREKIRETYFLTHGDPIMYIDKTIKLRHFLESWKEKVYLKKSPKSILMISAHWGTDHPTVTTVDHPETIHDYDDYPDPLYQIKYPVSGAPKLAKRVQELLASSGLKCEVDNKRGFDHGVWFPLQFMYPEAEIPVCQLSVQPSLDGAHHFNMGKALAPLMDEDVLIIGSGGAVHPSDDTPHCPNSVAPWAAEFDTWLVDAVMNGRYEDVNNYNKLAPNWELAHPGPEHLYPLHVAIGAAGEKSIAETIHNSWARNGVFGYASFKFTCSTT